MRNLDFLHLDPAVPDLGNHHCDRLGKPSRPAAAGVKEAHAVLLMVVILMSVTIDDDIHTLRSQIPRPLMYLVNHEKIDSAKLKCPRIGNLFSPLPVIIAADDIDRRVGFQRIKNLGF